MDKIILQTLLLKYIDESELNKLIHSSWDSDYGVLRELLKLKYDLVVQGKHERLHLPVHSLFSADQFFRSGFHAEILKYALLVQKDEYELKLFECFIDTKLNSATFDLDYFCMVFSLLEVAFSLNDFQIKIDQPASLCHFYSMLSSVTHEELMVYISTTTEKLISKVSASTSLKCLETILTCKNPNIMCCVIEYFLLTDFKSAICDLLHKHNIWEEIDTLIRSYETVNQRQGIFLLQQIKHFYVDNKLFTQLGSHYIKLPEFNEKDTESAWNAFFILSHVSREKQIHLVKPSLTFLPDLFCLHSLWVKTLYCILLNHAQNEIVSLTATSILTSKWFVKIDNFLLLRACLVEALSKIDYSKNTIDTFVALGGYVNECSDETFWILLEDIIKIPWNPINMWLYCKNIFKRKHVGRTQCATISQFLNYLQSLPHKYIRTGCMHLCVKFFGSNQMSSEDLIKLAMVVNNTDVSFEYFCNTFKKTILKHKISLENKVQQLPQQEPREVAIVLRLWKTLDHTGIIFQNCDLNKFPMVLLSKILSTFDFVFEQIDATIVFNFLENVLRSCDREMLEDVKYFIKKLSSNTTYCLLHNDKILHICCLAENVIKQSTAIECEVALSILKCFHRISLNIVDICEICLVNGKEESLMIELLEIFFENISKDMATKTLKIIETLYEKNSDKVTAAVIRNLALFITKLETKDVIREILQTSFQQILKLCELFKSTLEAYLESVQEVGPEECCEITRLVLALSCKYSFVVPILTAHLKRVVVRYPQSVGAYVDIFVECLLSDACVRKEERSEYYVCKDIHNSIPEAIDNSYANHHALSRYLIFESILYLINNELLSYEERTKFADDFAYVLIAQYKVHLNKRYFKDSMIHTRKLRIVQALLLLQPYLSTSKNEVIDLMFASICTESHQHCVRQLIQWLLMKLLNGDEKALQIITSTLESTLSTKVSAVSALIPILFHVTLLTLTETILLNTMDSLLPWTMGTNFKLRVYSQVSIHNLYEKAVQHNFTEAVKKYNHVYSCIASMFSKADDCIVTSLQTDEVIFNLLNPIDDYSLETILIDIPKINKVIDSEWEGYRSIVFKGFKSIKGKTSSKEFSRYYQNRFMCETDISDTAEDLAIVQRKMTPWKDTLPNKEHVKKLTNLVIVASFVDKTANIGGLTRTCEIFGVKQLVVNDIKIIIDKEYKSLSMCSEGWVNITEVKTKDVKNFLIRMKSEGYNIIAAEQTSNSVELHKHNFQEKTVLILGNEKEGIPANVLPLAETCVEIPQLGVTRSLNVHVAGSLFIWEYSKKYL